MFQNLTRLSLPVLLEDEIKQGHCSFEVYPGNAKVCDKVRIKNVTQRKKIKNQLPQVILLNWYQALPSTALGRASS